VEKARAINNPCRFTANSSSLRDLIECEIGFEPLGALVSALFIAPQMRRTFAYRQRAIERLLITPQ
jgi:hypothetical protein